MALHTSDGHEEHQRGQLVACQHHPQSPAERPHARPVPQPPRSQRERWPGGPDRPGRVLDLRHERLSVFCREDIGAGIVGPRVLPGQCLGTDAPAPGLGLGSGASQRLPNPERGRRAAAGRQRQLGPAGATAHVRLRVPENQSVLSADRHCFAELLGAAELLWLGPGVLRNDAGGQPPARVRRFRRVCTGTAAGWPARVRARAVHVTAGWNLPRMEQFLPRAHGLGRPEQRRCPPERVVVDPDRRHHGRRPHGHHRSGGRPAAGVGIDVKRVRGFVVARAAGKSGVEPRFERCVRCTPRSRSARSPVRARRTP